jgi:hypothetical protein
MQFAQRILHPAAQHDAIYSVWLPWSRDVHGESQNFCSTGRCIVADKNRPIVADELGW